jgi:hypothetical protein
MSQQISNMFVSQYKKKTSLLSQQTGKKNGKKSSTQTKLKHERIAKHTSIGRRPKTSSMNKHKKRTYKYYNGQGR